MIADALYIAFGYKVDQASINKAEGAIDTMASKVKTVAIAAAAVLAPVALGKFAQHMVMDAATTADAAIKTSRALGITTEAVQELQWAAVNSSVPVEALTTGIVKLSAKINDAATGNKETAKTFRELNLDVKALKDLKPDEQFEAVAEALSKVDDQGKRTRLSMKLLEEMGPKFATMFDKGAAGIREMREQARDLGIIISEDDAKKAEEFNASLTMLGALIKGLVNKFALDMMPVIQEFVDLFASDFKDGVKENKVLIAELQTTLKNMLRQMLEWLKYTIKLYDDIGGLTGVVKMLTIALVAAAGAYFLLNTAGRMAIMTNLKVAASAAAAAFPYVVLAATIGLVMLALDDLRGWIEGEDSLIGEIFGPYSEELLQNIQTGLIAIGVVLAVLLGGTLGVVALIALALGALFVYWDDIGLAAEQMFTSILKGWRNTWRLAKDGVRSFVTWLEGLWGGVVDYMTGKWSDFVSFILQKLSTITDPLNELQGKLGNIGGEVRGFLGIDGTPTAGVAAAGARAAAGAGRAVSTGDINVTVDARGMDQDQAQVAVTGGLSDGVLRITNDAFDE